jgi:ATP-dependent helicase/nuclease subunit B
MKVVFGARFDAAVWPGPLLGRDHDDGVLDEAWVGPRGLVAVLETHLGLSLPDAPSLASRASVLAERLVGVAGPWSTSAAIDPYASAQRVLGWRDALLESGLNPRTAAMQLPARIRLVLEVTRGLPLGVADRAWQLIRALDGGAKSRLVGVRRVDVLWSPLWLLLCDALSRSGVAVIDEPLPRAPELAPHTDGSARDLSLARSALSPLTFVGDGSVWLSRPRDEMAAAEDLALALAARPAPSTVIIGATPIVDAALRRVGLPTMGLRGPGVRAADAWLGLVTALARTPPDVDALVELCLLPEGPIPRRVGGVIARALQHTPAVHAPTVGAAWRAALDHIPELQRARLRDRIEALWPPRCDAPPADVTFGRQSLIDRVAVLRRWLFARSQRGDEREFAPHLQRCDRYLKLLSLMTTEQLNQAQHRRLLGLVHDDDIEERGAEAQAGIASVSDPAMLTAPVSRVVWWNFLAAADGTSSHDRRWSGLRLTATELAQLEPIGCTPVPVAGLARQRRHELQRALDAASQELWLVAPLRDADGQQRALHPVWDDWLARTDPAEGVRALTAVTIDSDGKQRLSDRVRAWHMTARPAVTGYLAIEPGGVEVSNVDFTPPKDSITTPSQEETLLGCSLRWWLERQLSSHGRRMPDVRQSLGTMQHAVMAQALQQHIWAVRSDDELPTWVATAVREVLCHTDDRLLLPRAATRLAVMSLQLTQAMRAWRLFIEDNHLQVMAVEQSVDRNGNEGVMRGRPDVVFTRPDGRLLVIDHKTGGDERNERRMLDGAAVQLLLYSWLVSSTGSLADVGYAQLRTGRFFVAAAKPLAHTTGLDSRTPNHWLPPLRQALGQRRAELRQGRLLAPGASSSEEGVVQLRQVQELSVEPPCFACSHGAACGRSVGSR